eukprot:403366074
MNLQAQIEPERKYEALKCLMYQVGYQIDHFVDEGGLAAVYKVIHPSNPQKEFVAKIIDKRNYLFCMNPLTGKETPNWTEQYFRDKLMEEVGILRCLDAIKCPNIIEAPLNIINTTDYWYLIHKYYNRNTLQSYLNKQILQKNFDMLPEVEIRHILRQLLNALIEVHRINIAHSDLKAQNILFHFDSEKKINCQGEESILDYDVVLADFGFATLLTQQNDYLAPAQGGSRFFYSPEQLMNEEPLITKASDIWALGVLTYMMIFKRYPFLNQILKQHFPSLPHQALDTRLNADRLTKIDMDLFLYGFREIIKTRELELDLIDKRLTKKMRKQLLKPDLNIENYKVNSSKTVKASQDNPGKQDKIALLKDKLFRKRKSTFDDGYNDEETFSQISEIQQTQDGSLIKQKYEEEQKSLNLNYQSSSRTDETENINMKGNITSTNHQIAVDQQDQIKLFGISIELLNFMDKCFKWKIEDRATAMELIEHPFITGQNLSGKYVSDCKFIIKFDEEADYFTI